MSNQFNLTFVTYYLHDKDNSPHNPEWDVGRLAELANTGIPLYVFVNNENKDDLDFLNGLSNIYIKLIEKPDLWMFQFLKDKEYRLPETRDQIKDTADHLSLTHSKVELVYKASLDNPWNTTHFAYIDFNITYLFWNKDITFQYLYQMSKRTFFSKILMLPDCARRVTMDMLESLKDIIYWRFCGPFFIGDKESIAEWRETYYPYFSEYFESYKTLTWDVNFLSWVEVYKRCDFRTYAGNHNDSLILGISVDCITKNMSEVARFEKHNYPVIPQFRPTSASYIKTDDGKRWLNIRYVNYWLYKNGCYGYPTNEHVIENKNMLCELDENMIPIESSFRLMDETLDMPLYEGHVYSRGLEDIRLYTSSNGTIRCIATNVNYSPNGKNHMIESDYNMETHTISNGHVLMPPNESGCEKNWIPLDKDGQFIYKWHPLEIGRLDENNKLNITHSYPTNAFYFDKIRGSTTFIEVENGLLGLVHFSEEHSPRHYYHTLVLLEKGTYRPLKYSNFFCFKKLCVEFCIGFTNELENDYVFWISQMDRDPLTVFIPKLEIPLCFEF